jgi:hypothetical protein
LGERDLKLRDGDWGKRERWPRSLNISFRNSFEGREGRKEDVPRPN